MIRVKADKAQGAISVSGELALELELENADADTIGKRVEFRMSDGYQGRYCLDNIHKAISLATGFGLVITVDGEEVYNKDNGAITATGEVTAVFADGSADSYIQCGTWFMAENSDLVPELTLPGAGE